MTESTLSIFKVEFDSMEWQEVRFGVRHKVYCEGSRQIRLVEFTTSEGPPNWCDLGHVGFVLAAGDGLFIPSGAEHSHKALTITPGTRLVMVEDV
jgi:hypothetical protein